MNTRPEPILFLPMTLTMRLRLEATIENLIALLDEVDGDLDREPDVDDEDGTDAEPDADAEHDGDELEDDARDLPA